LYASPNIRVIKSRKMRLEGHETCVREMRNAYKILIRKPVGKRPLRKPRFRWKDNIRIILGKYGGKM